MRESERKLVNPSGRLLPELEARLFFARKTKPVWAKRLGDAEEIETLEGRVEANVGDYLCRGIASEFWPQQAEKFLDKYEATGKTDGEGWQEFTPRPDILPVEACKVLEFVIVNCNWGQFQGKPNDYVVRSTTDKTDIWIVDQAIFEASYERIAKR